MPWQDLVLGGLGNCLCSEVLNFPEGLGKLPRENKVGYSLEGAFAFGPVELYIGTRKSSPVEALEDIPLWVRVSSCHMVSTGHLNVSCP